jgi:hypothetical protein
MRRTWAVLVAAALVYLLTGKAATSGLTGLTRSIVTGGSSAHSLDVSRVGSVTLDGFDAGASMPDGTTAV